MPGERWDLLGIDKLSEVVQNTVSELQWVVTFMFDEFIWQIRFSG